MYSKLTKYFRQSLSKNISYKSQLNKHPNHIFVISTNTHHNLKFQLTYLSISSINEKHKIKKKLWKECHLFHKLTTSPLSMKPS